LVLLLDEGDVAQTIDMEVSIRVTEAAFASYAKGETLMPKRLHIAVEGMKGGLRVMPAALLGGRAVGLKTISGLPGARDPSSTYFLVVLFDPYDGRLLSIMGADVITRFRTGAASAIATKYLARKDSKSVGVYGAGVQARAQLEAMTYVRGITEAKVYDVSEERLLAFCKEMSESLDMSVEPVSDPSLAASTDIVVTATTSDKPFLMDEWVRPGTHINAMGANSPAKRELDLALMKRSRIFVDFREQALVEAGDLGEALRSGGLVESQIEAELGDLVLGRKVGRNTDREVTLFKSVGVAIEDVALAREIYDRALKKGLGREVSL
jgi:ornithine cyclodeaminase/alanine dehydrogenase